MSLITALSPTDVPPKPEKAGPHIPGGPDAKPKHELYLDLQVTGSFHSRPRQLPRAKDDPEFLLAIRDAIFKTRQPGGVPFDVVHIISCSVARPNPALWEALADAQPSHLEMVSGWDESCNYAGLSKVQPPWNLKSMYLSAYEGNGSWDRHLPVEDARQQQHSFPACYASLETLVLDYPGGHYLNFYPVGGATNLRSLTILENDAVTVFARTVDCNPNLVETLRSVTLGCSIQNEGESVRRMQKFFKQAKGLATLELAVGDRKVYPVVATESEDEDPHHSEEGNPPEPGPSTEDAPVSILYEGEAGPSNPSVPHQISTGPFENSEGDDSLEDDDYMDHDGSHNSEDDPEDNDEDGDDSDDDANGDPQELIYTGLPDVLPNTLQSFSLSGPANSVMLKELDEWIVRARDQSWLPKLRTIAFRLMDPGQTFGLTVVYLTDKEKEELEQKVEQLLNIFTQRSPPVEVVEPRPPTLLRYPLAVSY